MVEKGFTIWMTGLSGSGKTTLAGLAEREIRGRGLKVECLDGEAFRTHLSQGLGFTKEDRDMNVRRIGFVCHLLSRNGIVAIASAISPYRAVRDEIRERIGAFIEVYVKCPLEICIQRDDQGLYKKARTGEIAHVTGISDPYEAPLHPEIIVETDKEPPRESLARILKRLEDLQYLPGKPLEGGESFPHEEIYSIEEEDKLKKRLQDLGYI